MHLSKKRFDPDSLFETPRQEAWWGKGAHARRRPYLLARNAALAATRTFFAERGFVEVETSVLQRSPGNETHLHAFSTEAHGVDGEVKERPYLHTSPEFAAKKLLAAGEERIFTLARCFRNREEGPLHVREFVMLEWYRAYAPFSDLIEESCGLIAEIARACESKSLSHAGASADPFKEPEILTVAGAFERFAGIKIDAVIDDRGYWRRDALAGLAGVRVAEDDTAGDIFSRILIEKIEPRLGNGRLTFLTRYPLAEAALARPCEDDARFAERFELYACGVELANAFGELTDPQEQRTRFMRAMDEKRRIYNECYPIDEDFLAALSHMPETSGIALGFERLLMLALGAKNIREVMWTP